MYSVISTKKYNKDDNIGIVILIITYQLNIFFANNIDNIDSYHDKTIINLTNILFE